MRYAIIGDIHANLAAFTAVLEDIAHRKSVEKVWCLGDVVGYGPDPHECIELLCQTDHVCVAGNHDWATIGKIDTAKFNPDAAAACHWTAQHLSPADVEYLRNLPPVIQEDDFTLVHGSPRELINIEGAFQLLFNNIGIHKSLEFFSNDTTRSTPPFIPYPLRYLRNILLLFIKKNTDNIL